MNLSISDKADEIQLYVLGQIIVYAVDLTTKLAKSEALQNAYRYTKIVNYSSKGFSCTQAIATKQLHDAQLIANPLMGRDIEELLAITSKMKSILSKLTV